MVREVTDDFASVGHGLMVRRDAQYLRWRYLQHPDVSYLVLALHASGHSGGTTVTALGEQDVDELSFCCWALGRHGRTAKAGAITRQEH